METVPETIAPAPESTSPDLHDKYLRTLAELDNLRKRTSIAVVAAIDGATAAAILEFLPIIDDFQRVIEFHANPDTTHAQAVEGIALVMRKFNQILERLDVQGFTSIGEKFSAELMEAVTQVPDRTLEPGTVVAQIEQGFVRRGKLLRPAKVAVAIAAKEVSDDEP